MASRSIRVRNINTKEAGYRFSNLRRLLYLIKQLGLHIFALFLTLFVAIPFTWVIFTAVKTRRELTYNPTGLPEQWLLENFTRAWEVGRFDRYFMNSIYVSVPAVILILLLSLLASYPLSLVRFRGRKIVFGLFLLGLAIPLDILVIPLFYILLDLKMLNTHLALILPQTAKILPFGVLLLTSFISDLPREILEAAEMDGCNPFDMLVYIVTPLCKPALTSLLIFSFMWTWNQFLLPNVLIQVDEMRTLPIGLNYFQGRFEADIPLMMSGAVITFVPIVVVYFLFQRQFIRGIASGALK
jgi:raffinose/stachyose/melibiose transport system permease protein